MPIQYGNWVVRLDDIHKKAIEFDLAENGRAKVIARELDNHECYYTADVEGCVDAFEGYVISTEEIIAQFNRGG